MPPVRSSAASGEAFNIRKNLYSSPYKRLVAEAFRANSYTHGTFAGPSRVTGLTHAEQITTNNAIACPTSPVNIISSPSTQVDQDHAPNPVAPQLVAVTSGISKSNFFKHPSSAASAFGGVHPLDSAGPSTPIPRINRRNVGSPVPFRLQQRGPGLYFQQNEEDRPGSPMSICNTPASTSTRFEQVFGDGLSTLNFKPSVRTAESASPEGSNHNGVKNVHGPPRPLSPSPPTSASPPDPGHPRTTPEWNSHVGQIPFEDDSSALVIARPPNPPPYNGGSGLSQLYYTVYRRQVLYRKLYGVEAPVRQAIDASPVPSTDGLPPGGSPASAREMLIQEASSPITPDQLQPSEAVDFGDRQAVSLRSGSAAERRMAPIDSVNPEGYNLRPRSYMRDGKQVRYGAMMRRI